MAQRGRLFESKGTNARPGRGGVFGTGLSSLPGPDREALVRLRNAAELRQSLAGSAIVRNLHVGRSVERNGLSLEISELQMREAACFVRISWSTSIPDLARERGIFLEATVVVVDETSTAYDAMCLAWPSHGGSGNGEFLFRPRPPDGVGRLELSIADIVPWYVTPPGRAVGRRAGSAIHGPWDFVIAL